MPPRNHRAAKAGLRLIDGGPPAPAPPATDTKPVAAARLTQAQTARFADLCFSDALAVFVERGEKIVVQSGAPDLRAGPGDALLFAPGALFTIENRVWGDDAYAATVIRYPDAALREIFGPGETAAGP